MENNLDFFDDVSNHAESLWGSYLAVPAPIVSRGQLRAELQDAAVGWSLFDDLHVTAHETSAYRRNQSVRTTGKGLDYNWEPNFQWGSFGSASIGPGACQRKLDSRLIAYAFVLGRCCGRTCAAAMAIRRIRPSVPSTRSSPAVHTLLPRWCLFWGLRTLSICIRRFNFSESGTLPVPLLGSGTGGNQPTTGYTLLEAKAVLILIWEVQR